MTAENGFAIAGRRIGRGHPVYVVAEMSANHGRRLEHALDVVRAAADCGADAVKIQTYTADTITLKSDAPSFRVGAGNLWSGRTLHDLYDEAHTPWEWQPKLKALADSLGIHLFSSPFDPTAVDFLEEMGVPAHKIASPEIVDLPLVERIARTGKPIIMSTGMATLQEIAEGVDTVRRSSSAPLALLKCTSAYPAPPEDMNLATIPHLEQAFGVPVGLSDHTLGNAVALAAVALGACIVEKHFCLSRAEGGPDSAFSMEPHELRALVEDVRRVEVAVGKVDYSVGPTETPNRAYRRSLFVVRDVRAGQRLGPEDVRSIRPAAGLHPRHLGDVLGRVATRDIPRGTPLAWNLLTTGG